MTNPQLGWTELAAAQAQPEVPVNFSDLLLAQALAGQISIEFATDANLSLAANAPPLSTDQWAYAVIRMTDSVGPTLTTGRDVVYPNVDSLYTGPSRHTFLFINETLQTLTVKRSGQAGVAVGAGRSAILRHNGTDIEAVGARFAHTTADQTAIGTAYTDVTGLTFSVVANGVYEFEFQVWIDSDATTTGIDVAVNGPASPTAIVYEQRYHTALNTIVTARATAYDANTASTDSNGATARLFSVKGILRNGANAGTLALRAKREAVGTGPNVRSGSWGRITKIN